VLGDVSNSFGCTGSLDDWVDTQRIQAKQLENSVKAKLQKQALDTPCHRNSPTTSSKFDEWVVEKARELPSPKPRDDGPAIDNLRPKMDFDTWITKQRIDLEQLSAEVDGQRCENQKENGPQPRGKPRLVPVSTSDDSGSHKQLVGEPSGRDPGNCIKPDDWMPKDNDDVVMECRRESDSVVMAHTQHMMTKEMPVEKTLATCLLTKSVANGCVQETPVTKQDTGPKAADALDLPGSAAPTTAEMTTGCHVQGSGQLQSVNKKTNAKYSVKESTGGVCKLCAVM